MASRAFKHGERALALQIVLVLAALAAAAPASANRCSDLTQQTESNVIAPDPAHRTPIPAAVPGVQLNARIASDPTGEARFLLRLA